MKRRPGESGFTLVQLLVSIGIISLLMGFMLVGVGKIHETARRTEDLSNLRQLVLATNAYAIDNAGAYPVGRNGGNKRGEDDYTWINNVTAWGPLCARVPELKSINSCASVRMGFAGFDTFGKLKQKDAPSDTDVEVGWIYWGGRDDLMEGKATKYRAIHYQGQRLTPSSQTLWTCWCWDTNGTSWPSICPHVGSSYVEYPPGVELKPTPDGMGIALTDGSASFVAWNDMIIITQFNRWKLYYQP